MESGTLTPTAGLVEDKGLKKNAISFLSNIVIGVASTAPAYSLAATLGYIALVPGLGVHSPAVMLAAFPPMAFIAAAYYWMNRADPDCGTTFSWMTKAMGPWLGWQGGWAIVVADVLVMPSLSQIAGQYTFSLFGNNNPSVLAVTIVGIAWIVLMTWICYRGIELSARVQQALLALEFFTLILFSVVALIKVYTSPTAHSIKPALTWFNPFDVSSTSALVGGILLAVFVYWGWDSGVSVNEETEDSSSAPGRAAIISTFVLVAIYLLVTTAAQAYGGLGALTSHPLDVLSPLGTGVLGSPLNKLLIICVLTSASASTQTTILPTARTTLSMARAKAIPGAFANIHPRFLSPGFSTLWMGVVSTLVYILLAATSTNYDLIGDAFTSLALTIAFYYGFTGLACVIYYRKHLFTSWRNFLLIGVLPFVGWAFFMYILVKAVIVYSAPHAGYASPFLGIGSPIAIAILMIILGIIFMLIQRVTMPSFFKNNRPQVVDPAIVASAPAGRSEL
ncbi:MAG: APC family permease [Solirubrobacteraceae bacterium]